MFRLILILMTDPDASSRQNPIYCEILLWLIENIPGNRIKDGQLKTAYNGAGAPRVYINTYFQTRGESRFCSFINCLKHFC